MLSSKLMPRKFGTRLIIMIILAGLIPIVISGLLLKVFGNRLAAEVSTALSQGEEKLIGGGEVVLQEMAEKHLRQKTIDVALQLDLYLQAHPEKTLLNLQGDPIFREIAIQPVGETGYTAIQESNTAVNRFHRNPEIENLDLHTLASKLPDFWAIMEASLGGALSGGHYQWQEADGTLREKFMYIVPLKGRTADGIPLSVAATTYFDEFTQPIIAAKAIFGDTTLHLRNTVDRLIRSSIELGLALMGASIVVVSIMAYWLGTYFSGAISQLKQATRSVNQGKMDVRLKPSMSGEIGELIDDFNKMVAHLAETTVSKERLEDSEHKLRTIVEHSTNLFYSHTADHVLTYMSPRTRDFFDCEPDEALVRWTELISDNPVNLEGFEHTQRAIDTGERQPPYELQLRGKKGREIWVEVNESPVVQGERTVAIVGALIDITERKRAEEELRRSHQTLLTILDGIDSTVYVADMDSFEILFMNRHMIDDFGADLTGRPCYEAFRGESDRCAHCSHDRLLDTQGNPTGVSVWETRNPVTGKWYINHDRAIPWVDGRIVKLQIAMDITRLKELEQERIRAEEQLQQANKMESVGRLAGGVAHDFNNKIQAIFGYTSLALSETDPESPVYPWLQEIEKAAQQSADLTRQLLAFARKQTIRLQVLNLNKTISGMLNMLRRIVGENIELQWTGGRALWNVMMDPAQVDQVIVNLVVNGRDAISGFGQISLKTENTSLDAPFLPSLAAAAPGDYVLLTVSDNGAGMSRETIGSIFEPFFTTKELGKGTGLGLATVYGIVKQNGGFIDVESELGQGATFNVYLPRHEGGEVEATPEPVSDHPPEGTETVLIVEDEGSILSLGKSILQRLGYRVLTSSRPSEAIRLAEACDGHIHLVITDVVMPEMNGRDLAERLIRIKPGMKCLFMSGYAADVIARRGVLDEGLHFIPKPFSVRELSETVRQILQAEKLDGNLA